MITPPIKKKIQDIVSVFETSSATPQYDMLVCLPDGPGGIRQITYGKHQVTEYSNLHALVKMYCDGKGVYAGDLESYLPLIGSYKHPLAGNLPFKKLLKQAGGDEVMREAQDSFFDMYYWNPALNFFSANQFEQNLSMAVIYDSYIHSGGVPMWLRKRFDGRTPLRGGNEKEWITEYVSTRDNWLEHNANKILRNTDYRTDCWKAQIENNNWDLSQAVVVKFNSGDDKEWVEVP